MSRATVDYAWRALLDVSPVRARLVLGKAAAFPELRNHAYTDGETVTIAPRMLEAPLARVVGVLAHELGHCAAIASGFNHHTEREADEIAEAMFGFRIAYDRDDVQTVGPGVRPRPARLK